MITVACECGQEFRVSDQAAGRLVACPSCQESVGVPTPDKAAAPTPAATLRPLKTRLAVIAALLALVLAVLCYIAADLDLILVHVRRIPRR